MAGKDKEMPPITHEKVEVDGIYTNEWGREEYFKRGEEFSADPILGSTEWRLTEYDYQNHHEGRTDERLISKKTGHGKQDKVHPQYSNAED